jgi:hypothetical protein
VKLSAGRFRCSGRTRGAALWCLVRLLHRCFKCEITTTRIFAKWKQVGRPRTEHGDSYWLTVRRKVYLRKPKDSFSKSQQLPSVLVVLSAELSAVQGHRGVLHARTHTHTQTARKAQLRRLMKLRCMTNCVQATNNGFTY